MWHRKTLRPRGVQSTEIKETLLLVQNIPPSLEYSKWCVNVFRTSLDKLEKKKSAN